jgi:hypothetical protein
VVLPLPERPTIDTNSPDHGKIGAVFECLDPAHDLDARGLRAGGFSLPMRFDRDEAERVAAVAASLESVWP